MILVDDYRPPSCTKGQSDRISKMLSETIKKRLSKSEGVPIVIIKSRLHPQDEPI